LSRAEPCPYYYDIKMIALPAGRLDSTARFSRAPAVRSVNATWSLSSDDACTAIAASSAGALRVSVEREKLTLSVFGAPGTTLPGGFTVPVAYAGPSGSWTLAARTAGPRRIVASEPMMEVQASRILFLLEGGAIRLGRAPADFPTLRIPNAGLAGQAWFDCVRKVLPLCSGWPWPGCSQPRSSFRLSG